MLSGLYKSSGSRSRPDSLDRFIPNRSSLDFDYAHFKVMSSNCDDEVFESNPTQTSPYQEKLISLNTNISNHRILPFSPKTKNTTSANLSIGTKKRRIPTSPEKILDLPYLRDDYYSHLLDWSSLNNIAVGLEGTIYSWNVSSHKLTKVRDLNHRNFCTALSWSPNGKLLAIGTALGAIEVWDHETIKNIRTILLSSTVNNLLWQNDDVLISGLENGIVLQHSLSSSLDWYSFYDINNRDLCNLVHSPDKQYLAIGSSQITILNLSQNTCVNEWKAHNSVIRGLVYIPLKQNILASGGGYGDGCIRFWDVNSTKMISEVVTKSQICSLLWADNFGELVSGHGYEHNDVILWKYPSMEESGRLQGYTSRVLHTCLSPDGSKLATASSDETLRIWACFEQVNKNRSKQKSCDKLLPSSPLSFSIR